ncbi:type IV secretion system DNA-binding domain-containing protein [Kordiimonas pumila]|uniref:Type IV secretion system DNA-binding domain-containing protein n=1 Tax=Kordiimonas pumila TaxID=2161677 RepID=A0ABV7D5B4_9PROT|nr:type IV secretion system DNA-binding domain-containing protein [Kordiimonas pumila]
MANFFRTPFSTFIRGAQTTIHEYQMMAQSLHQTLIATLLIIAGFSLWHTWQGTTPYDRYIIKQWFVAGFKVAFSGRETVMEFEDESGKTYLIYADRYSRSSLVKKTMRKALDGAIKGGLVGISLGSLITLAVLLFFYLKGRHQTKDFHIRGARIGTATDLIRFFRKRGKKGVISLGGIRLPASLEPTSIALVGAPRTGKSVQIASILKEIRRAKKRAIIYDYGGNFTRLFYRPGIDFILNPTDERSVEWRPWYDALEPAHYEQQAASLVPESTGGDSFWPIAARTVYVALTRKLAREMQDPSLHRLLYWGLQSNADDVVDHLKNTEAAAAFSKDKTAASIMSHLASYLKSFNYLPQSGKAFSIRHWVRNEENDSWLFIATRADQIDALRPLISMWVDIATSAILSLPPSRTRRIFGVYDELPTMNVLPSLLTTLTNAPKYGGCHILGYQSHTLLKKVYGAEAAEAITGACALHCIYRAQDVATAEWAQKDLGDTETAETNEGYSYGVSQIRDGRTANIQRSTRPLILASEIRSLSNLQFYLNAGSGLPVVPLEIKYVNHPAVAESFIARLDQSMISDSPNAPTLVTKPAKSLFEAKNKSAPKRQKTAISKSIFTLPLFAKADKEQAPEEAPKEAKEEDAEKPHTPVRAKPISGPSDQTPPGQSET